MQLRKIREGIWMGLWCLGTVGDPGGLAYKDELWQHSTVVTNSSVSPCSLHTDLFSQLFISQIQRQPPSVDRNQP